MDTGLLRHGSVVRLVAWAAVLSSSQDPLFNHCQGLVLQAHVSLTAISAVCSLFPLRACRYLLLPYLVDLAVHH